MYTYQHVGFRPIDETDLEQLRELRNDPSTLLQLGTVDMVSGPEQAEWWRGLSHHRTDRRYTLVDTTSNTIIGLLRVQNVDSVNAHCEIGLDIVPALRGRGHGTACYRMVLEYLFLHHNMHLVYLRVAGFNDRARSLYERLGFTDSGRYPEYLYRHGRYWDYTIMAMTREHYMQRHPQRHQR